MATILGVGDLAFVQYHSDTALAGDMFSFVLFVDIDADTVINFTETGINGAAFQTDEGGLSWTPGVALTAGTVIALTDEIAGDNIIDSAFNATTGAPLGTVTDLPGGSTSGISINSSGDSILAFQGALDPANLIYGVNFGGEDTTVLGADGWNVGATIDGNESNLAAQLDAALNGGIEANFGGYSGPPANPVEVDNGFYQGITSGTADDLRAAIADISNWTFNSSGHAQQVFPVFTVGALNAAPIVDLNDGGAGIDISVAFDEAVDQGNGVGDGLAITPGGTLSDADAGDNVDTVTFALTNDVNGADEQLFIDPVALTMTGGVTVSGNSSDTLVLTRNGASEVQLQAAMQAVHYQNNSDNPTTANRTINVTANDGTDASTIAVATVTIAESNDAPTIQNVNGGFVGFSEGDSNLNFATSLGFPGVIDQDDIDLNGGSITVTFSANGQAEDQLQIENEGFAVGQVGISGSNVFFSGSVIGTFAGGINGAALVVTFTAAGATATAAAAIIAALQYNNSAGDNPNDIIRAIDIVVNDGSDDSSVSQIILNVTAVDDPAVAVDDAFTTDENTVIFGQNIIAPNPAIADSDPDDPLTVTQVDGSAANVGVQITIASGALVTVAANGLFTYIPNGAFDETGPGLTALDSFTYQLNGEDTATVNITINGVDSDDTIIATVAAEAHDGGAGNDTISFENSAVGVIANMDANNGTNGDAQGDTFANIENMRGSAFDDVLSGSSALNVLEGGAGADTLNGFGGNDTLMGDIGADILNGGADIDTVDYTAATNNQTINLGLNIAIGGFAAGDTYISIENVKGSDTNGDRITGSVERNVIEGQGGDDFLRGYRGDDVLLGGEGNDFLFGGHDADDLNGGNGLDWAMYNGLTTGVDVDLLTGFGSGGQAAGDTYANIERVRGSLADDTITGTNGINKLLGDGGNDTIDGMGGKDVIRGGDGDDIINGGAGNDGMRGDAGSDTFIFELGSGHDFVIDFEDGIDTLNIDDNLFAGTLTAMDLVDDHMIKENDNRFHFDFGNGDVLHVLTTTVMDLTDFYDDVAIV